MTGVVTPSNTMDGSNTHTKKSEDIIHFSKVSKANTRNQTSSLKNSFIHKTGHAALKDQHYYHFKISCGMPLILKETRKVPINGMCFLVRE